MQNAQLKHVLTGVILLAILFHFNVQNEKHCSDRKYIALLPCEARVSNQLFNLASGYGIARRSGRVLHYVFKPTVHIERVYGYVAQILEVFPRLGEDAVIRLANDSDCGVSSFHLQNLTLFAGDMRQTLVPHAMGDNGEQTCWRYEDPIKYASHASKFVVLNTSCAQNSLYFQDYLPHIRRLLTFSYQIRTQTEVIVARYGENFTNSMCVHNRQTDFADLKWAAGINDTFNATVRVAQQHNLTRYFLFGDDQAYLNQLASMLNEFDGSGEKVAEFSTSSLFEDFYLASRMCSAFLMSSAMSTSGWWMAFFTRDQHSVYYMNDQRQSLGYFENITNPDDMFLPTWNRLP